jgi:23S rRNA (cytidine1920-2'-O)/16S rRNA (cytidine1409-2'-O)-methyltransferase
MATKQRLDAELVRRGLARSRDHARELVGAGQVRVAGIVATKPATGVDPTASVVVTGGGDTDYVSRGGNKLAGALDALGGPLVAGRRCIDAGASTGGFTDVLLRRGAREVVAVDVGYGQLAWRLRNDDRVRVHERTNIRDLDTHVVGDPVDLTVADLSFISLTVVLPALVRASRADADLLVMVKPQFEVGRDAVGRGGVVRDPGLRGGAVCRVADTAASLGLGVRGVTASAFPGPAGNVEYFLWLAADAAPLEPDALERAITQGPQ